jgi:hypothetical protein
MQRRDLSQLKTNIGIAREEVIESEIRSKNRDINLRRGIEIADSNFRSLNDAVRELMFEPSNAYHLVQSGMQFSDVDSELIAIRALEGYYDKQADKVMEDRMAQLEDGLDAVYGSIDKITTSINQSFANIEAALSTALATVNKFQFMSVDLTLWQWKNVTMRSLGTRQRWKAGSSPIDLADTDILLSRIPAPDWDDYDFSSYDESAAQDILDDIIDTWAKVYKPVINRKPGYVRSTTKDRGNDQIQFIVNEAPIEWRGGQFLKSDYTNEWAANASYVDGTAGYYAENAGFGPRFFSIPEVTTMRVLTSPNKFDNITGPTDFDRATEALKYLNFRLVYKLNLTSDYISGLAWTNTYGANSIMPEDVIGRKFACAGVTLNEDGRLVIEKIVVIIYDVKKRFLNVVRTDPVTLTTEDGIDAILDITFKKFSSSTGNSAFGINFYFNMHAFMAVNDFEEFEITWQELVPGGNVQLVPLSIQPKYDYGYAEFSNFKANIVDRLMSIEAYIGEQTKPSAGESIIGMVPLINVAKAGVPKILNKLGAGGAVVDLSVKIIDFVSTILNKTEARRGASGILKAITMELAFKAALATTGSKDLALLGSKLGAKIFDNREKILDSLRRTRAKFEDFLDNLTTDTEPVGRVLQLGFERKSFLDKKVGLPLGTAATNMAVNAIKGIQTITGTAPYVNYVPAHSILLLSGIGVSEVYGGPEGDDRWLATNNRGDQLNPTTETDLVRLLSDETNPVTAARIIENLSEEDKDRMLNAFQQGMGAAIENIIDEGLAREDPSRQGRSGVKNRRYNVTSYRFTAYDEWAGQYRSGWKNPDAFSFIEVGYTTMSEELIAFYVRLFENVPAYELFGNNCQRHTNEARQLFGYGYQPPWMRDVDGPRYASTEWDALTDEERIDYEISRVSSAVNVLTSGIL